MLPSPVSSNIVLAQYQPEYGSIFIYAFVLIALVMLAFVLVSFFRKRILDNSNEGETGFSLSSLRELHRSGKLTDEEFEKSKAAMVAALKAGAEKAAQRRADAKDNPDRRGSR